MDLVEFAEFCRLKMAVNGPDVHMKCAGAATAGLPDDERRWRLAIYNCFSSVATAAVIWSRWPRARIFETSDVDLAAWLRAHWKGIPIRNTRRPVRAPHKLARCLKSVAAYDVDVAALDYEAAWKSLDTVYSWGRYVRIKYLETLRRFGGSAYAHLAAPDIRARDAWSPRRALAWLYPTYAATLDVKTNDRAALNVVSALVGETRAAVMELVGCDVSHYELEALLCNYRQSLTGKLYVGRTIDSELEYHRKVAAFWDEPYTDTDIFAARRATFPVETLGEVQGWDGPRPPLFFLLTEHGYIWSDLVYDYRATTDFAHPVRR